MSEMTPREIVSELDSYIIGQHKAKRAVSIALRNRWRRMQLDEALRHGLPRRLVFCARWRRLHLLRTQAGREQEYLRYSLFIL